MSKDETIILRGTTIEGLGDNATDEDVEQFNALLIEAVEQRLRTHGCDSLYEVSIATPFELTSWMSRWSWRTSDSESEDILAEYLAGVETDAEQRFFSGERA